MSEVDRMNFIVSELLVLGKPNATHYREIELISILDDTLKIFESQAVMNGISVTSDIKSYGNTLVTQIKSNKYLSIFLRMPRKHCHMEEIFMS